MARRKHHKKKPQDKTAGEPPGKNKIKLAKPSMMKMGALLVVLIFVGSSVAFATHYAQSGSGERIHTHADFAVFVNGEQLDFDNPDYYDGGLNKNYFLIDLHTGQPDVLHMHPQLVGLDGFFSSIGWEFTRDCLRTDTGDEYCNNETHSVKFYVNGVQNDRFQNYVFEDLDKILISYGPRDEDVSYQLDAITDMAIQVSGQPG